MTPELQITLTGSPASGKSAVAELIRQQLEAHGITATLTDDNGIGLVDEQPGVIATSLQERLHNVGNTVRVSIQTAMLPRANPCLTMI